MIEQDTVKLLRECDAGIKMGVASLDDVLGTVRGEKLKKLLQDSKHDHQTLGSEILAALDRFHDNGKNPNPIAKGMSKMKTSMKLTLEDSDATVANLMAEGCDMGVRSLSRYLNQYKAADEDSKDIAKRLIHLESQLSTDLRGFL